MFDGLTPAGGQEVIVGCLTTAAIVSIGSEMAQGKGPEFRSVLGYLVAGIGLGTLNMFNPQLAGGFAALILTGAVFVHGGPMFDAITRSTNGVSTGSKGSKAAPLGPAVRQPTNQTIQA